MELWKCSFPTWRFKSIALRKWLFQPANAQQFLLWKRGTSSSLWIRWRREYRWKYCWRRCKFEMMFVSLPKSESHNEIHGEMKQIKWSVFVYWFCIRSRSWVDILYANAGEASIQRTNGVCQHFQKIVCVGDSISNGSRIFISTTPLWFISMQTIVDFSVENKIQFQFQSKIHKSKLTIFYFVCMTCDNRISTDRCRARLPHLRKISPSHINCICVAIFNWLNISLHTASAGICSCILY